MCVCGSVTTITRNCVHRSSPNWVLGAGNDHLQLIKFWPSGTPGKGVCGGEKLFDSALLQPARSVWVSLSPFSFICVSVYYLCAVMCVCRILIKITYLLTYLLTYLHTRFATVSKTRSIWTAQTFSKAGYLLCWNGPSVKK